MKTASLVSGQGFWKEGQPVSFYKLIMSLSDQGPELVLEQLLQKKLKNAGVQAWRGGAKALTRHLIDKEAGEFHWEDYPDNADKNITIKFTKEDGYELERIFDKFQGNLDKVIGNMTETAVTEMLSDYQKNWHSYRRAEERFVTNFRNNLEDRWGKPLDGLRLFVGLMPRRRREVYS